LSGGEVVEVEGRTGYRVVAMTGAGPVTRSPLSLLPGWWLPAVAVVDSSSGRLLRLTRYRDGRAAIRLELRSLTDGGSDDFAFTPPDGLPVVEEPDRDRSGASDENDDDPNRSGPDGRQSFPSDEVRAVVDAAKKQLDEAVTAARGFLGSLLGGPRLAGFAGFSRRGNPGGRRSSRAGLPRPGSGRRAASGRSRCRRTRARSRRRRRSGGRRSRARPRGRAAGP
jgi:hypothetical protein